MSDAQYWAWFWKNITIWLPITIPLLVGAFGWALIQWWAEQHEDDEPKKHFTSLFGKRF